MMKKAMKNKGDSEEKKQGMTVRPYYVKGMHEKMDRIFMKSGNIKRIANYDIKKNVEWILVSLYLSLSLSLYLECTQ